MKWARVAAIGACGRSVASAHSAASAHAGANAHAAASGQRPTPMQRPTPTRLAVAAGTAADPQPLKALNSVPIQALCLNYGS